VCHCDAGRSGFQRAPSAAMYNQKTSKRGFSLLELLAVVTILGVIAAIIVPRVSVSNATAKTKVRDHQKATINAAVERYYIDTGNWQSYNRSDIGVTVNYVPDGLPPNPVDGTAYSLNTTTHRVN